MVLINDDFIDRDFILENKKESLAILFLLMRNITLANRVDENDNKWHQIIFSMRAIYDDLNIQMNRKKQKDRVIEAMSNMIDNRVFQSDIKAESLNINELARLETVLVKKDFTMVSYREFKKIFNYNEQRVDHFGLFNVYLAIKKHANTDTGMCYPSIDYMRFICDIKSNGTASKYINILESIGLISCMRGQKYIDVETKEVRNSNNQYTVLEIINRKLFNK